MKKFLKNLVHPLKDLHFSQRMFLVYIIGGIIPLLAASLYTNFGMRKMMIDLRTESQSNEVLAMGDSIRESVTVLNNVARLLCLNDDLEELATKDYPDRTALYQDYYNLSVITEYLNYYQQDISKINVYIHNPSVDSDDLGRMEGISYLDSSVMSKSWYLETVRNRGQSYWFYTVDPETTQSSIQVSRAMWSAEGEVAGVVTILLQESKTWDVLQDCKTDTALMYNDGNALNANYDFNHKHPFLSNSLSKQNKNHYSQKVSYGGEEYLLTYDRIVPPSSKNYYSIVSIQEYSDIMTLPNRITLQAFIPELVCMALSVILIMVFTYSYEKRLNAMRIQMHRVAQGEYDLVEPLEGNDEVGDLYQELEKMMEDIQKLISNVVIEQVQKEKLHTRQKEVEFQMLASQINPHFLYNTLETIRMKAVVNKQPEIVELVKMLAKTMRYNIQVRDRLVTLHSELEMVGYYLKIQEYRFGDRIQSEVVVEPDVDRDTKMMPLIIQPFVENAFVHGLEEAEQGGMLRVHVTQEQDVIRIVVQDNGVGMDYYRLGELKKSLQEGEDESNQSHIGMRNVNQRLKMFYGEEAGIFVESEKNLGTKIVIFFPVQTEKDENL